jgi:hypothetical protein
MTAVATKLMELETRVTWLERVVRELRRAERPAPAIQDEEEELSERERVLAELKAEGLIRDLTPQERAAAAQWEALPEEEKEAHIRFMNSLTLDPPLSQIIIENRR